VFPCLSPVHTCAIGMRIVALDALLCLIVQFGQGLNDFRTDKSLYYLAVMNVANDRHSYWSASWQSFMKLMFSVLLPLEISEGNSNITSHWRCFHFVWQLDISHSLVCSQAALMKGLKLSRCPLKLIVSDLPLTPYLFRISTQKIHYYKKAEWNKKETRKYCYKFYRYFQ